MVFACTRFSSYSRCSCLTSWPPGRYTAVGKALMRVAWGPCGVHGFASWQMRHKSVAMTDEDILSRSCHVRAMTLPVRKKQQATAFCRCISCARHPANAPHRLIPIVLRLVLAAHTHLCFILLALLPQLSSHRYFAADNHERHRSKVLIGFKCLSSKCRRATHNTVV